MKNKILKLTSGIILGGALALVTSHLRVDAKMIPITTDGGAYIFNMQKGENIYDYNYACPKSDTLGVAEKIDTEINSHSHIVNDDYFFNSQDTYKLLEDDIIITFKYPKKVNVCVEKLSSKNIFLEDGLEYTYAETFTKTISYTVDVAAGFSIECDTKLGINGGIEYGMFNLGASLDLGLKTKLDISASLSTTISHTAGQSYSYLVRGKGKWYNYHTRANFDIYTIYHFKANIERINETKRWNSVWSEPIIKDYRLDSVYSSAVMINNSMTDSMYEVKSVDGEYIYDGPRPESDKIYYIDRIIDFDNNEDFADLLSKQGK